VKSPHGSITNWRRRLGRLGKWISVMSIGASARRYTLCAHVICTAQVQQHRECRALTKIRDLCTPVAMGTGNRNSRVTSRHLENNRLN
jgi:hypothetical protein